MKEQIVHLLAFLVQQVIALLVIIEYRPPKKLPLEPKELPLTQRRQWVFGPHLPCQMV
jgi:hypothetical protein